MPIQKLPIKKLERPVLWIVAGPNGSGKSTLYDQTDIEDFGKSVWIINPDLLTARIREVEKLRLNDANLAAVKRIEKWLKASIEAHRTVGVETVLSTPKYRRLVRKAKERKFEIRLIYVLLNSPDLSVERVRLRVKKGGHHVPPAKVRGRYHRSLEQLPWFMRAADKAYFFDNSGATPVMIALKDDKGCYLLNTATMPPIKEAIFKALRMRPPEILQKLGKV